MTELEYKKAFLEAHDNDFKVVTDPMDEYGRYTKCYLCADGAQMWEVNGPIYRTTTVEVCGVKVPVEVKLMQSELWNSDNAESVFFYERW